MRKYGAMLPVAMLVAVVFAIASCGAQQCEPDQIRSEDYGCIDRDDLDLNDDGSFEDEEREWDDD